MKKTVTTKPKNAAVASSSYPGSIPPTARAKPAPRYSGTACVITSHNYGNYLAACLDSCIAQSVPFESIVVVDDSSSDNTREIAEQYADRGVKFIRGEWKNYGKARMAGLAASPRTPYLLFVDADNVLSRRYHQQLLSQMAESNVGAVYGQLLHFDESGTMGLSPSVKPFDRNKLRQHNIADACSLIRREAFEQVGGWKTNSFLTDWMLWLDMTRYGWQLKHVPGAILNYRIHPRQMSKAREGNFDLHVTPLRESCMVAVVTLFSGREWSLDHYFSWLEKLEWNRGNLHLVAIDNSSDADFAKKLKSRLIECGLSFSYSAVNAQALAEVSAAELAGNRAHRSKNSYQLASHLARLYAVSRQYVPTGADFVWSVEDDIEPPADALHHLLKGLFCYPKAGAISGCARSRFEDQWILWRNGKALREPVDAGRYVPVEATGFYCTLMRRAVFDQIAFRPTRDWSLQNCAYDWAAIHDIIQSGSQVLAAGSVRCRHWQADGSYV